MTKMALLAGIFLGISLTVGFLNFGWADGFLIGLAVFYFGIGVVHSLLFGYFFIQNIRSGMVPNLLSLYLYSIIATFVFFLLIPLWIIVYLKSGKKEIEHYTALEDFEKKMKEKYGDIQA